MFEFWLLMEDCLRCCTDGIYWTPALEPPSIKLFLLIYEAVACYLRVEDDPAPALLFRMTWDELLPLVFSAPGMPFCERPVDVLIPLALPLPVTFLIELFKLAFPVLTITLSTFLMLL